MKTFLCLLLGALILVLNITMSSCQRFPLSETNVDMKFDSLVNELAPPPGFWHRLRQTSQAQQVLERVRVINNLNEITRGGSTSTDLDQILQSLSLWLAGIVAWQSLTTLFCHNDNLFHEVCLLLPASVILCWSFSNSFVHSHCSIDC
jgi:5'(3')-deoxyribonucleotidase